MAYTPGVRVALPLRSGLLRAGLLVLFVFGAHCSGAQANPDAPEPGASEPSEPEPCECQESRESAITSPLPSWSEPTGTPPPSKVLIAGPREVVRIEPPRHRDPVDVVLSRGRRRVRNLSLHQAPVDDTLRMFATMGRFNVVIPGELGSRKVSIELRDVSLAGAFRAVLATARLEARVVADNILEVRPAGAL